MDSPTRALPCPAVRPLAAVAAVAAVAIVLAVGAPAARADGLVLRAGEARPALPTIAHVTVEIRDQIATTVADLTFLGVTEDALTFLFPVPERASVVGFEVFEQGSFRAATLSTESPMGLDDLDTGAGPAAPDPVLDAYLGPNPFLVPLPGSPDGQRRVRLTYIEILPYDMGALTYTYPHAGPATAEGAMSTLDLEVELRSGRPVRGVQYPGFTSLAEVLEESERYVRLRFSSTLAGGVVPDRDFQLFYGVVQSGLYVQVLTDHESCEDEGYFLLVVEPPQEVSTAEIVPKYFTFVVDTSGSMSGYKIEQAKQAAEYAVRNLNSEDRFNVITFDDYVREMFDAPEVATAANRDAAVEYVRDLWSSGSTNLNDALETALGAEAEQSFARLVILLSDGEPTAGEVDPSAILENARRANRSSSRVFTFGVGQDVNRGLLEALASEHRGEASFLDDDADIAGVLGQFFQRVSRPVLTDVTVDYGAAAVSEVHPDDVTDLFAGTQLLVIGRYRGATTTEARLTGQLRGAAQVHPFPLTLPACAKDENPFLPRLWAKVKIDELRADMAAAGYEDPATVAEVVALATRYGIQTPYTSYGVDAPSDPAPYDPPGAAGPVYPGGSSGGSSGGWSGGYSSGALEPGGLGCQSGAGGTGGPGSALLLLTMAFAYLAFRRPRPDSPPVP